MSINSQYPAVSFKVPARVQEAYRQAAIQSGYVMADGETANLSAWIRNLANTAALTTLGEKKYAKVIAAANQSGSQHPTTNGSNGRHRVKRTKPTTTGKVVRK